MNLQLTIFSAWHFVEWCKKAVRRPFFRCLALAFFYLSIEKKKDSSSGCELIIFSGETVINGFFTGMVPAKTDPFVRGPFNKEKNSGTLAV